MAPRLQCLPTSYQPRGPGPERVCSPVPTGPQSLWILVISEGIQGARSVFISGHGVTTPDQVYRFLPCDYDPDRIERTTVRSADFQDFLSKIGGKVLVFLDTCYSGDVLRGGKAPLQSSHDKFANELSAAENGAVVFA